jgi:hypothetical protein
MSESHACSNDILATILMILQYLLTFGTSIILACDHFLSNLYEYSTLFVELYDTLIFLLMDHVL